MHEVETLARGEDSRLVEPRRFLIRDRQSFSAVWAAHAGPAAAVPAVNFDTRMVAAVFAGERPSAGFSITVTGTRHERLADGGSELVVLVDEQVPDPARVAAQIIVSPFHIATLPRDDGKIRFSLPDPSRSADDDLQGSAKGPRDAGVRANCSRRQRLKQVHRRPRSRKCRRLPDCGRTWREASPIWRGHSQGRCSSRSSLQANSCGSMPGSQWSASAASRWRPSLSCSWRSSCCSCRRPRSGRCSGWRRLPRVAWVGVWALCLVNAFKGRLWKLPYVGQAMLNAEC